MPSWTNCLRCVSCLSIHMQDCCEAIAVHTVTTQHIALVATFELLCCSARMYPCLVFTTSYMCLYVCQAHAHVMYCISRIGMARAFVEVTQRISQSSMFLLNSSTLSTSASWRNSDCTHSCTVQCCFYTSRKEDCQPPHICLLYHRAGLGCMV